MRSAPDWKARLANGVFIRPLHRADVTPASEVAARAFDSPTLGQEVREQLRVYCRNGLDAIGLADQSDGMPREYYAIARPDGAAERIIGVAGLYRFGTWTWSGVLWLGWFCVDPGSQGQGLGSAALGFVERIARSRGAEMLKVETLAGGDAARFYRERGYVEEAVLKSHYGPAADAEILSRSLSGVDPADLPAMP